MVTTGVQFGSDAVSARLASNDNSDQSRRQLQQLINIQTKLTTMVALPAAAGVFLYSWPIFHLWVGHSLDDYQAVMPPAVYMSRILTIALAARAISDTWLLILYGAGFVRAYAPWILAGGLFAPVASVTLMFIVPEPLNLYVPAAVFAFVLLTVHQFGLPIIVGRCLHLSPLKLFSGVFRPLLATIVAAGCALLLLHLLGHLDDLGLTNTISRERATQMNAWAILASIGLFGCVYTLASYAFVLNKDDRKRMTSMLKRKTASGRNDSGSL
jgi:O-antigen/teichoic acid export membrane protein